MIVLRNKNVSQFGTQIKIAGGIVLPIVLRILGIVVTVLVTYIGHTKK